MRVWAHSTITKPTMASRPSNPTFLLQIFRSTVGHPGGGLAFRTFMSAQIQRRCDLPPLTSTAANMEFERGAAGICDRSACLKALPRLAAFVPVQ
jgi:hypothetical protein